MATVTGMTAEAMQEIRDAVVVDAEIDVAGHLILTLFDTTTIDAGPVMTAAGQPFVGQYTTGGRPDAAANTGKILWDITLSDFYKSNGVIWEVVETGGGGAGDVASTDTDASGWDFVLVDAVAASDLDTKLPTEKRVNSIVGAASITAQIASTNTSLLDVYTVGSITYLQPIPGPGGGGGGTVFEADVFRIVDPLDALKVVGFNLAGLTEERLYVFPDEDGFLLTEDSTQELRNKTLATPTAGGQGFGLFADFMLGGLNVGHTSLNTALMNQVHLVGGPTAPAGMTMWHNGGLSEGLFPSALNAEIGRISARGTRSNSTLTATDAGRIFFSAREAPTLTAQGTDIRLAVCRIGATAVESILGIQGGVDASTAGTVTVRSQLIVGANDMTTAPAAGYGIESKHATNGIGYGVGAGASVTQLTSKATATPAITTPNGTVITHAASLAADTVVSFTLTHANLALNDHLVVTHTAGGTLGAYSVFGVAAAGSGTIYIRNLTAGALGEALTLRYHVVKGSVT